MSSKNDGKLRNCWDISENDGDVKSRSNSITSSSFKIRTFYGTSQNIEDVLLLLPKMYYKHSLSSRLKPAITISSLINPGFYYLIKMSKKQIRCINRIVKAGLGIFESETALAQ